ncbi:MAG: 3'-5' exonuclease, partial [Ginsengibacter sp.]
MPLQLKRSLVFVDLETTGVNLSTDRIVEIALVKVFCDGTKAVKQKIINPQIPIPKSSSDIHGITNEKVKDAPVFKQVANELKQFIDDADLSGYNSNRFDIPLLREEFLRAGITIDMTNRRMLDVQHIYHMMEKRTLSAAYKFYCEKELNDAHSAEADATATWEILEAQLTRYENLGNTLDTILQFTGEEKFVDFGR